MFNRKQVYAKSGGFTLIELLIVIGIIAIISVVLVLVLNPVELLKRARDTNRLSDLQVINKAISIYSLDIGGSIGTASTTYISIPDPAATSTAGTDCSSLGLPAIGSGAVYHCPSQSNYRNTDGTGWIPINFNSISSRSPLGSLPTDPVNATSTSNYFMYDTRNGQWEISATTESNKYIANAGNDGGDNSVRVEIGTNLTLAPAQGHGTALFITTGLGEWTAPTGVFSVFAETWAGGGGGGGAGSSGSAGGGGAGGGYSAKTVTVIPGIIYSLSVGNRGAGGGIFVGGAAGGDSWFWDDLTVLSKGGGGGENGSSGAGGTAGTGAVGTTLFVGGSGASGINSSRSGGGGGGAGSAGNGGSTATSTAGIGGTPDGGAGGAGRTGDGNGMTGNTLGGGGSGAISDGPNRSGGAGARGQVKLTW